MRAGRVNRLRGDRSENARFRQVLVQTDASPPTASGWGQVFEAFDKGAVGRLRREIQCCGMREDPRLRSLRRGLLLSFDLSVAQLDARSPPWRSSETSSSVQCLLEARVNEYRWTSLGDLNVAQPDPTSATWRYLARAPPNHIASTLVECMGFFQWAE